MDELLEREGELEAIGAALEAASEGKGRLVLVDGPAGVGKTTLMRSARETASEAGMQLLTARGNELERPFGFGVVRQLFEPALVGGDADELLKGAARFVATVLDIQTGEELQAPGDTFSLHNGIYWLTANLAAQQPLAILVDDLHWSDDESVEALAHLGNRLDGIPVALIAASRIEESRSGLEALRRSASELGHRLRPSPLGLDSVSSVVRTSVPEADDALCDGCLEASGGNPFLLSELVRSLAEGGSQDPATVLDGSPERVTRELSLRIDRLPDAAGALARAAAVLGDGSPLRRAASLAGLGEDQVAEAADSLVAAGILRQASPVEFLHPLVRAGLYAGIGPAARSGEHARAAKLMAAEGESATRVATQLLRCEPAGDPWVLAQLLAAAENAKARGASEAAVSLLARALAEPPSTEMRSAVLLDLGVAEISTARATAAFEHVREALGGELGLDEHLRGTLLLAAMLVYNVRSTEAIDVLQEQLGALSDRPDLQHRVEVTMANLSHYDADAHARTSEIRARFAERVRAGEEDDPGVLASVALDTLHENGSRRETITTARRSLANLDLTATSSALDWGGWLSARTLMLAEDFDEALRAMDRGVDQGRAVGESLAYAGWLAFKARLELRLGDLPAAEVDVRTSLAVAQAAEWQEAIGFTTADLAETLLDRGEVEEATSLHEAHWGSTGPPRGYSAGDLLRSRARCRLTQGRIEEAVEDLRAAGETLTVAGVLNPAASPWRSELSTALLGLGQQVEAKRLATEELELAREFGAPRAYSIALRGMARVEGGSEEIRLLREAAEVIESSPAQLERARVHAQLGAALRRERSRPDAAREPLRLAVDLAHRCGARSLEEEALGELRATGARPRRRLATGAGALTPSERRIAALAAAGRQNREIAESLFVTVDTVEFHLRNIYKKLGISRREELPEKLDTPG